jgi:hypothetical protein
MKIKDYLGIIFCIGVLILIYQIPNGKPIQNPVFDENKYKKKIDSLNAIITKNKIQNDSLRNDNTIRNKEIANLNKILSELNNKSKRYEQLYKNQIDSINNMSDNDVTRKFTDIFK